MNAARGRLLAAVPALLALAAAQTLPAAGVMPVERTTSSAGRPTPAGDSTMDTSLDDLLSDAINQLSNLSGFSDLFGDTGLPDYGAIIDSLYGSNGPLASLYASDGILASLYGSNGPLASLYGSHSGGGKDSSSSSSSSSDSKLALKLGLGIGIPVGVLLIVGGFFFFFCLLRRLEPRYIHTDPSDVEALAGAGEKPDTPTDRHNSVVPAAIKPQPPGDNSLVVGAAHVQMPMPEIPRSGSDGLVAELPPQYDELPENTTARQDKPK
ncbi:hypothetical protein H4R18_003078 [Coemansia javaensis]|uniref:Mid2 domain-containing protein n=1 Tax=Coemansia javaensis TaxID=2761396 RepID=A0A9W8H9W9_9FUNG|nr:hypothetical protein H4R18_003078 [Coemansia javaensis]